MYYRLVNGQVARETNEELRSFHADPAEGFDIRSILSVARRFVICFLRKYRFSGWLCLHSLADVSCAS